MVQSDNATEPYASREPPRTQVASFLASVCLRMYLEAALLDNNGRFVVAIYMRNGREFLVLLGKRLAINAVELGLGHIVAVHCCLPTLHRNRDHAGSWVSLFLKRQCDRTPGGVRQPGGQGVEHQAAGAEVARQAHGRHPRQVLRVDGLLPVRRPDRLNQRGSPCVETGPEQNSSRDGLVARAAAARAGRATCRPAPRSPTRRSGSCRTWSAWSSG